MNQENKNIKIGDIIIFKKQHPCGGNSWKVLRVGIDFKLECTTCKHQIMITRLNIYKRMKVIKENKN